MYSDVYLGEVPYLTTAQMIEVDRLMVEDYQIQLIQMMENAGRNLAQLARERFLSRYPKKKSIIVLAGTGGNGGGALVCARWLHNWGVLVRVFVTKSEAAFAPIPAHQLGILRRMNVPIARVDDLLTESYVDLIIDGIIGYGIRGTPKDSAIEMIRWANRQPAPILALDVPSGLDATTGVAFDPIIRAAATMTLALPKEGLRVSGSADYVGELYLADIGVPPELYMKPSINVRVSHIFAERDIVRLR